MLTSSSQGTLGSGFINILVIPSDIKIFSISCDFYYLLFSLFFQVQRLGDCQVFSLWAGDNLSHIPGFSFKTCLFQATASWPPNPKAFFSPYLLLLSLICGLVDCAFPKPSCGLRDVTLSWFPLTSMRVTFQLVCSVSFPCVSMTCPRSSWLCSLPASDLQEGKSGDKELVRKLLQQRKRGADSAKWQWE